MTFTPNIPTTPGAYWWRLSEYTDPDLIHLKMLETDVGDYLGCNLTYNAAIDVGGLWCRLVPAEEVKRAYFEGFGGTKCFGHGDYRTSDEEWPTSLAKRVAEGLE
jgi:hypothetical protein